MKRSIHTWALIVVGLFCTMQYAASQQDLFVNSLGTNNVLEYDGNTGIFNSIFATGGGLNTPADLTFGPDGNLYVSSEYSGSVLRFNGTTGQFMGAFVTSGSGGLSDAR